MKRMDERLERINVQLPVALKAAVASHAHALGESVSEFLRRAAQARVDVIEKRRKEERMREAYQGLAAENRSLARQYEAVDLEERE